MSLFFAAAFLIILTFVFKDEILLSFYKIRYKRKSLPEKPDNFLKKFEKLPGIKITSFAWGNFKPVASIQFKCSDLNSLNVLIKAIDQHNKSKSNKDIYEFSKKVESREFIHSLEVAKQNDYLKEGTYLFWHLCSIGLKDDTPVFCLSSSPLHYGHDTINYLDELSLLFA